MTHIGLGVALALLLEGLLLETTHSRREVTAGDLGSHFCCMGTVVMGG